MGQREDEGWPLGLQPVNVRIGFGGNGDFGGSVSFNTLVTGSPTSSTDSSSDLDTQSTGSFFQDKSITLGSIIGVSSRLEPSRRSVRVRSTEAPNEKKSKNWLFSLCSTNSTDADNVNNLVERRQADNNTIMIHNPIAYGGDDFIMSVASDQPNSLFVDGHIAPPQSTPFDLDIDPRQDRVSGLFSCMCAHS